MPQPAIATNHLVNKVRTHLWELANTIEVEPASAVYRPLIEAAVIFLREASVTLDYPIDKVKMNRDLILSSLDFLQRWETWLDGLKSGSFQYSATRIFHEMLIRFSKGAIKAYRCWRIDILKP